MILYEGCNYLYMLYLSMLDAPKSSYMLWEDIGILLITQDMVIIMWHNESHECHLPCLKTINHNIVFQRGTFANRSYFGLLTSWASYGVCLVSIVETIGHFVMELDCLDLIVWLLSWRHINWWTQLGYWMHICNTEHLRHCFNASCVCPYEIFETNLSAFLGSEYNLMTLRY